MVKTTPPTSFAEASLSDRIDALITSVVPVGSSDTRDRDLVHDIISTALKVVKDSTGRGDVKIMNTALKELRYSFLVFEPYKSYQKVAVYGSARTGLLDPNYLMAEEFGRRMAEDLDWMVITGAGPGIMEAANKGAGTEASFGVNIRLPFEAGANDYLSPGKVINFKYFFTRKVQFVKESDAFALFPGGFGTLDETFELLTLIQTGKADLHPIVMIDAEGTGYWDAWVAMCNVLEDQGMISPHDKNLYKVTNNVDEAIDEIASFFRVYHSQRYVNGKLVLRLKSELPGAVLSRLTTDYADIIQSGSITKIPATRAEIETDDFVDLHRISFDFDRRGFGRLRALIDELNAPR
ncbi:MAG: TIGR00730 family Rossman fold protein [Actinomycetota bacterium]|nr:TIGR00730 family Rossman fold protein [Actinomycetota bacterium]